MLMHTENSSWVSNLAAALPQHLSVSVRSHGEQVVLQLDGELAYHSEHVLRRAIEDALMEHRVEFLILDLARIEQVTSAGIGLLLIAKDVAKAAGATLVLANTADYVQQIYKIAHFGRMMPKLNG